MLQKHLLNVEFKKDLGLAGITAGVLVEMNQSLGKVNFCYSRAGEGPRWAPSAEAEAGDPDSRPGSV